MEMDVAVKRKSRISSRMLKILVGISALILFRYFREGRRKAKNEEGD